MRTCKPYRLAVATYCIVNVTAVARLRQACLMALTVWREAKNAAWNSYRPANWKMCLVVKTSCLA